MDVDHRLYYYPRMPCRDIVRRSRCSFHVLRLYPPLIAASLALGCSAPDATTSAEDIVAVSRLMVTLDRVTSDGAYERLAGLLAEDAVFMPPGEPAILGRPAIVAWHRERRRRFRIDVTREPLEVDVANGFVIHRGNARGTLTPIGGGEPTPFDRKYLMVLTRGADGSLLIWREIHNDNRR